MSEEFISTQTEWGYESPRKECGVFGIYDMSGNQVAETIYYGLLALQHRGQKSCGIAVSDTNGPRDVKMKKGMGMVPDVFDEDDLNKLTGNLGVGHVRSPKFGEAVITNAQPLVINYVKGTLILAHNGTIVNSNYIRDELAYSGSIFQTSIDSETIAYLIAKERINSKDVEEAVARALEQIKGSYALVMASPRKLIGARDPFGIKPLCIGIRDNAYILSSESCALESIGATFVRDVAPGEIVTIDHNGINSDMSMCISDDMQKRCIIEYMYFARPDSNIDGVSIYNSRIMAGKILAEDSPVDADVVVGVPDSGEISATGFSLQSGIPCVNAFVWNDYTGFNFVKPKAGTRNEGTKVKLGVVREAVEGKRVVVIDDSIIRGVTAENIVKMLREAGAKEVHVRVTTPAHIGNCAFGPDFYSEEKPIAFDKSVDEIKTHINADSLAFLKMERLSELTGGKAVCTGCFDGNYPMVPPREQIYEY
ncbi:MAG: amidophosphoribosyltransferase [Lachnospiraceae bacterium]|nr:amidophosphoribosyltransferase [Lachnospiraceae bacterium]